MTEGGKEHFFRLGAVVLIAIPAPDWRASRDVHRAEAKIAKYLGRETVIGDALTLPWDIANDANIDKYGIQGIKRRIGMDIYGNLIVMFAGAKIGGIKGGSTGIFSVLGLTEIKEAIAPPLIENERKQADDSYLREINSNVID